MSITFLKKIFTLKDPVEHDGSASFTAQKSKSKDCLLIDNTPFNDGVFVGWTVKDDTITITVKGALNRTTEFTSPMPNDQMKVKLAWRHNMCLYLDDKLIEIK